MTKLPINYITHANAFSEHIRGNKSLNPNHVSLYWALFYTWNQFHFPERFPVNRKRLKVLCRIGTNNTYARCMKDLHQQGLICYMSSPRMGMPGYIAMTRFGEKGELMVDNSLPRIVFNTTPHIKNEPGGSTENEPGTGKENEPAAVSKSVPYYKQNINKDKREYKQAKQIVNNSATLAEVLRYFTSAGLPLQEGRKFFYHYEAVGWKMGEVAIQQWQSAAHKWMENTASFTKKNYDNGTTAPGDTDLNQNKRYDIPL